VTGPLRGAAWTKSTPGNASAVCLHVVVINTALSATYAFRANISGANLGTQLVASRMCVALQTMFICSSASSTVFLKASANAKAVPRTQVRRWPDAQCVC
jgi:hypothetical protein